MKPALLIIANIRLRRGESGDRTEGRGRIKRERDREREGRGERKRVTETHLVGSKSFRT